MVDASKRNLSYTLLLVVILLITILFALSIGSVDFTYKEIVLALLGKGENETIMIINQVRLPRVVLALSVGGGLSVAGAVFQALLLNPLAEPYILGISSGGTFGAVLAMLLGLSFFSIQAFAFAGSILVIMIVFLAGKRFGTLEPNVLLLAGVMVGAFFAALILLMITFLNESLRSAVFWLMGNLSNASVENIPSVLIISIAASVLLTIYAQKLNVLSLGDENASHLGIDVKKLRIMLYIITSLMVGAMVSVSGIIGFVGLIIPHSCRLIFGTDNRLVIPSSFLVGAIFLIVADLISRTVIAPAEIPVGAITAVIGAPVFIYLIRKRFKIQT